MKDCWQVLGVPSTTDAEGIKRAYRALIKRYHPDTIISGPPEKIRRYTIRCRRINQAFRQAIERYATGTHVKAGTAVDRQEAAARKRGGGAARRAEAWQPPECPEPGQSRFAEGQDRPAGTVVTYLAPLLVIGSPLLILCFANMLWQMVYLLLGR
jgi:hypothetical protein